MLKLIGLRKNIVPCDFSQEHNGPTIVEYEFITKDTTTGAFESHKYKLEEGMCGSGYCEASWLHYTVSDIAEPGPLHYTPKRQHEWGTGASDDMYVISENCCPYYPSATLEVDLDEWRDTARSKSTKQLYVYHGESGVGKSHLASHLKGLEVYETDSNYAGLWGIEPLDYLKYDVVVLGNKHGGTIGSLQDWLDGQPITIVSVHFEEK